MRFANEGDGDRTVRMPGGTLLLYAGWGGFVSGALGIVLMAAGAIALVTGLAGWCPAYTVLGVSTRKVPAGRCPNCDAGHRL